nr:putative cytochrome C oxidase subunit 5B-like [Ipomoea batatas]
MPIATGHEREELEAELQGKKILDIDFPEGPFGTKEAPAVVKSYYDKRIVGCPGGEGEDEHDVVWFWLEKGKPHEMSCVFTIFCAGGTVLYGCNGSS